jgi:hypothetical protein
MTTCTTYAWRRKDLFRNHKIVMMKMSIISGDTIATCVTGLKKIYSVNVSPPAVTGKALDHTTVAGGTVTVNFADPVATCALYVTAIGI